MKYIKNVKNSKLKQKENGKNFHPHSAHKRTSGVYTIIPEKEEELEA